MKKWDFFHHSSPMLAANIILLTALWMNFLNGKGEDLGISLLIVLGTALFNFQLFRDSDRTLKMLEEYAERCTQCFKAGFERLKKIETANKESDNGSPDNR